MKNTLLTILLIGSIFRLYSQDQPVDEVYQEVKQYVKGEQRDGWKLLHIQCDNIVKLQENYFSFMGRKFSFLEMRQGYEYLFRMKLAGNLSDVHLYLYDGKELSEEEPEYLKKTVIRRNEGSFYLDGFGGAGVVFFGIENSDGEFQRSEGYYSLAVLEKRKSGYNDNTNRTRTEDNDSGRSGLSRVQNSNEDSGYSSNCNFSVLGGLVAKSVNQTIERNGEVISVKPYKSKITVDKKVEKIRIKKLKKTYIVERSNCNENGVFFLDVAEDRGGELVKISINMNTQELAIIRDRETYIYNFIRY